MEEPPYFIAESDAESNGWETEIVVPDETPLPASRPERPSRLVPPGADARSKSATTSDFSRSEPARPETRAQRRSSANDAAPAAPAPWLRLSESELGAIWLDATRELGFMLPTQASEFCGVRAEAPNAFYVSFPGDRRMQRDYCDREKAKIVPNLVAKLGGPVSLRCLLDETKKANDAARRRGSSGVGSGSAPSGSSGRFQRSGVAAASAPRENFRDLYRKIEENEIVRQIKELFDAELAEARPAEAPR